MDATTRPALYLIRHGETDWNARRLLQGRRDIPLNARGRSQAVASGVCLNWVLPAPAEVDFIASPLGRTRETMQIVRQQLGLPAQAFETDDRLITRHARLTRSTTQRRAAKITRWCSNG
jgi:probable phosphoglycerate mutase